MSKYTIRLSTLLNSGYNIWDEDNPYPIFDEDYRQTLNFMIEQHYFMQEIGTETPYDFKRMLNQRMREIMPLYNSMYKTAIDFDNNPLVTFHSVTTDSGTSGSDFIEGTRNSVVGEKTDIHFGYDTPMNSASVYDAEHMSNADKNEYGTQTNSSGHAPNQKDVTENEHDNTIETTQEGISLYEKIRLYREMAVNIDKMVIDELGDLFMMVF